MKTGFLIVLLVALMLSLLLPALSTKAKKQAHRIAAVNVVSHVAFVFPLNPAADFTPQK